MTGTLDVEECATNCKHFKRHKLYFVNKYSLKEMDFFFFFFTEKLNYFLLFQFCRTLATVVSVKKW